MKKTAAEIRNLITLASMVMFIYFAFEGLTALEDKRQLSREAECAKCCGENCGSDGDAACVNHVIIESHRNLLLCLVCLYLILLPVVFRNIIPNTPDK